MAKEQYLNGFDSHPRGEPSQSRADELASLLHSTLVQIIPFIRAADDEVAHHKLHTPAQITSLIDYLSPTSLRSRLTSNGTLSLPTIGTGQAGFESTLSSVLRYSVNPSSPGFLDKLYSAPLPIGIAADLILTILNTNVHVYHVSPVLTLIEKHVTRELASMFGLKGPRAGGINVQGGSASNMTSIVIARNTLYPKTKLYGNNVDGLDLVMFTSAHGHYSIEKAAQACGFGSAAVVSVPVDAKTGKMLPAALEALVLEAKRKGKTPFYVNATAGTTVLGSFEPFVDISEIAKKHGLWMHVDGAWGGSFVFSEALKKEKLKGVELADSIAINPHKMMGIPVTCSFLLGRDMQQFQEANTLRAGYLFHDTDEETPEIELANGTNGHSELDDWQEPNDLADMTLQCGRRGDSLKLFMAWQYYGTAGYGKKIEHAYQVACRLAKWLSSRKDFVLVSQNPPPCLQVCFHYAPGGKMAFREAEGGLRPPGLDAASEQDREHLLGKYNSKITEQLTNKLVSRGFMVDYAPALEGETWRGKFFRVVVNISTPIETTEKLVADIEDLGREVLDEMNERYK